MTTPQERLRLLAQGQHGTVRRDQARRLGVDRSWLHRRVRAGEWEEVAPEVLRLRGSPLSVAQRAMVAVLAAGDGAALSHTSAAAWWGLPGFAVEPVHVTVGPGRDSRRRLVHRTAVWPAHHRTGRDGVPVTTPARTVADLAAVLHPDRVEAALDRFWSDRLLVGADLDRIVAELAVRGRPGSALLRQLAAARGPDYVAPMSRLERRFEQLLDEAGDPPMVRQHPIDDEHGRVGLADFADPALRIVVEIDSRRHHTSVRDRRRDTERDARLRALGWVVIRIPEDLILEQPDRALALVRAARARRRAQLAA